MKTSVHGSNASTTHRALLLFAETVLRPVVRILLRYGMAYPEFNQVARKLYVDVAMQEAEFRIPRRKRQYKSRVACITGLSRKEVLRLLENPRPADGPDPRSSNRAARVLRGWLTDERYLDKQRKPLPIPFRAPKGRRSFSQLVHDYSGDITPRAVLDELLRAGSCVTWGDDDIRVRDPEYVARPVDVEALTSAAMLLASHFARVDADLSGNAVEVERDKAPEHVVAAAVN